jgi:hypothetical protein
MQVEVEVELFILQQVEQEEQVVVEEEQVLVVQHRIQ